MRPSFVADLYEYPDPNRYYMEVTITPVDTLIMFTGAERVLYTNKSGDVLDTVVFRLYPNETAFGARMEVTHAEVNGQPVTPRLEAGRTALVLPLPEPIGPGESVEVTLEFYVAIEKGLQSGYAQFSYVHHILATPDFYPVLSVYEDGGWWMDVGPDRGDAVYSETGLYEALITVPAEWTLVASGEEIASTDNGDGTITYHYVSGLMRDFALMASDNFSRMTGTVEDIEINVYCLSDDFDGADDALRFAQDAIEVYNTHYGPYPFTELDVVETPTRAGGIEYPGLIVVAEDVWVPGEPFFEVVVAHEVAHQWWYSQVGNDQVRYPWIDEALTSFTEYIYTYYVHGEERAEEYMEGFRSTYLGYTGSGGRDLPIGMPVSAYDDREYGVFVYRKGAVFFYALEQELGRDTLLEALQTYLERYRYRVARPEDLLHVFEEVSGRDLDEIFAEWVGANVIEVSES